MKQLLVIIVFAGSLFAQAPLTPLEFRDITYLTASGQDQKLDVFQQPSAKLAPVIVYFHGGAWWKGERPKSPSPFQSFLQMGFSVVSADYRLAGVAPAPAAVQDARCVLAWVKAKAPEYHFDVDRIVVYGTSAGGHLALMAGMLPLPSDVDLPQCTQQPKVAAILDFYGITDVTRWLNDEHFSPQAARWLGTEPGREAVATSMSPIKYVRRELPPIFMVHGDADTVVPYQQSTKLQQALTAAGAPNWLYTVSGGAHGKFTDEQKAAIMSSVSDFLKQKKVIP